MRSPILLIAFLSISGYAVAQVTHPPIHNSPNIKTNTTVINQNVVVKEKMDTVPRIRKFKHIYDPSSRYAKVVRTVYVPLNRPPQQTEVPISEAASAADSANLARLIQGLLFNIRNNYTTDVDTYVDTLNELSKVKKLAWTNRKVYRRDINGIAFNLSLLQNIFQKPAFDKEDLEMLSLIFNTNDSLIQNMKISNYYALMLSGLDYQFTIQDAAGKPVQQAICYFINKPDWRAIEDTKSCVADPTALVCPAQIIPSLEEKCKSGKLNYLVNQQAMQNLKLSFGPYHVLVLADGKLKYHQILSFDTTTPRPYTLTLTNVP